MAKEDLTIIELQFINSMSKAIYPTAWGNHVPPVADPNSAREWTKQAYLKARKNIDVTLKFKEKDNVDSEQTEDGQSDSTKES